MVTHFKPKKKLKVVLACFTFLFLSSTVTVVQANEWSGTVPVTYTKETSEAYPFSVRVSGAGSLVIGKDILRNEEMRYLLAVDEAKTIQFKPDTNAVIKTATLNGKDVSSEIKGNKLIVNGNELEQFLNVVFQTDAKSPSTGDTTDQNLFLLLLLLSLGTFIYLYAYKKKIALYEVPVIMEEQENEEDKNK